MTIKLLLVEDHEMNREMLTRRLKRLGYDVITAVDGAEAVELALGVDPDLILMDVSLPDFDGCEATRRIRQAEREKRVPIIALTALVHDEDRSRAMEAGCDEYETKPVELKTLTEKIDNLVSRDRD